MDKIPDKFPCAGFDRTIACGDDLDYGLFMIQLEMEYPQRLDVERLARALDLLLDAQPILGCRFVADQRRPFWERLEKKARETFCLSHGKGEYEKFRVSRLDSRAGPQVKACLQRSTNGDRMLLKATHQVCDAGGLMEIAADLSGIYSGLTNGPSYRPRPNLQGSRGVGQILRHVPRSAYPAIFLNFLRSIRSNPKTHTLPLAHGPRAPISFLIRHLSASRAARIIEYGRPHQATINDLLLAAFYRAQAAVGKWDGKAALRAKIMIDLRRWYLPMERAEGICNLSSYEFINIGRDLGDDFDSTLARVCAATRRRKASWLGLAEVWLVPLFNRLPYRWLVKMAGKTIRQKSARKKLPNGITNVGPIQPQAVSFGGPPRKAWFLPPVVYPPFFGIHLSGYSGSLTISSGFPQPILPLVEQFFDRLMAELPE